MPDHTHELEYLRQRVAELEQIEAEYRQMQTRLQEADTQYHNLFELAGDSIFLIDPANLTFLDANENAARRLGYEREELLALRLDEIEFPPEDAGGKSAWESKHSRTRFYECLHRKRDGTTIPVAVSSRLVKRNDHAILLNFVRDISHRKAIEAEREQLIEDLDAYAHSVAHDLKNPLAVILGWSELLLEDYQTIAPDKLYERLAIIHRTGQKMYSIIDELLLLASVRKQEEIRFETLNMAAIIQEVLGRLAHLIDQSGTTLTCSEQWPTVRGYAPWVEEVWINYLSNAIKYGGTPPLIECDALADGEMIRFRVRDNGSGIDPEEIGGIFKQFTRLDESRAEGHGLGLSIVRRIVERLGGQVGVESRVGEGSTFWFTLPLI